MVTDTPIKKPTNPVHAERKLKSKAIFTENPDFIRTAKFPVEFHRIN